jgi:hypothetical protein
MRNWRVLYGGFAILCVLVAIALFCSWRLYVRDIPAYETESSRTVVLQDSRVGGDVGSFPRPAPTAWSPEDIDAFVHETVKSAVDHLKTGSVTFNPPAEMRVGQTQHMEAVISQNVRDKIAEALEGGRTTTRLDLRVAPRMSAELMASSDEFRITPLSGENPEKTFGTDGKARWIWGIEPLKAGKGETISLVIKAIVFVPIGENGRDLPEDAITKVVTLTVDAKAWPETVFDFVKENWQWLWTALLVPFVPWAWGKLRNRSTKTLATSPVHSAATTPGEAKVPVVKGEAEIRTTASVNAVSDPETPHVTKEK